MAPAAVRTQLNPDAPLFIPMALRQVEDFSPEWWELVTTTAWFRDRWVEENHASQQEDDDEDILGLLPDSVDLDPFDDAFFAADRGVAVESEKEAALRSLKIVSPKSVAAAARPFEAARLREKPAKIVSPKNAAARRVIHQPR